MNNMIFFVGITIYCVLILAILYFYKPTTREDLNNKKLNQQLLNQQLAQGKKQQNIILINETAYRFMQEQQNSAKNPLLYAKTIAISFALLLILLVFGYYFTTERFLQLQQQQQITSQQNNQTDSNKNPNEEMIIAIQNKIRTNPNNGEHWYELGLAYAQNNEFDNAIESYSRATILLGRKPYILGAAATALYYKSNQTITLQVQQWLDEALELDPQDTATLLLLANDAFNQQHFSQAIDLWQKILDSQRKVDRKLLIKMMNIAEEKARVQ
ncbi:nitrite reductase [Gallibacterium salpingitidis]|uniref:TPR domain-containing protein n=1 Tax=Gallibacterium salpingitidis TaxID=505341 RepID=UPI0008058C18|nr:tetratricopeptide repeat protein [Gallibacterium salpingitidis]OBX08461.1 nitrite reductase [Gallibacterium salpingitidis]